jgi:hypothetical protein
MADTEFITARFPENEMPRTQTRAEARERVHGFIRQGERARIREAGEDWGPWRKERDAVERLDDRMARMGVGPKLIVQRENDREMLSIREVSLAPKIPELGANPHIEKSHGLTYGKFHDLRSGGVWLCRFIDGTRTVSKHGYEKDNPNGWKGAAEDTFVTSGGMDHLEEVAHFKVSLARKGDLVLATVIVNRTIWTAPACDPRPYGGVQHFHVHEDAPGGHACSP